MHTWRRRSPDDEGTLTRETEIRSQICLAKHVVRTLDISLIMYFFGNALDSVSAQFQRFTRYRLVSVLQRTGEALN